MTERLDCIEAAMEGLQQQQQTLQQQQVETDRQYRGMVQAVAAMADAHREFMQRVSDDMSESRQRLDRIEKIVESNTKSIQALSDGG